MQTTSRTALIIGGGIAGPVAAIALQRAGIDAVIYEAQDGPRDDEGLFLTLAPNGINVLKTLGIDGPVRAEGFPTTGICFYNGNGKRIGGLDHDGQEHTYGATSITIKRGRLHKALREAALRQGIPYEFGKKLKDIEVAGAEGVIAHFEDGTQARGDFLIGCDGIHSRTRRAILPDAPAPVYTGMVGCGGFARCPAIPPSGIMHMSFGKQAFFGYFATPAGEVYWFNNIVQPQEPARGELEAISQDDWRRRLLALHGQDPAPIPEIIRSNASAIGLWPIYDIPFLPAWHKGPVCLAGDAAHATSPHAGQGASMALEDAIVLARCLRDIPDLEHAFATYRDLRKARVEKLTLQARRTGSSKAVTNPIKLWLRDLMMPLFLKLGNNSTRWVYGYKVDWEAQPHRIQSTTLPRNVTR